MFPHAEEEGLDIVNGLWVHQLPVIEHQADPEVVHENREPRHDRQYPPWTSKLVPKRQTSIIPSEKSQEPGLTRTKPYEPELTKTNKTPIDWALEGAHRMMRGPRRGGLKGFVVVPSTKLLISALETHRVIYFEFRSIFDLHTLREILLVYTKRPIVASRICKT